MTPVLPNKFVPEHLSLVGQAAAILVLMEARPLSVAQLFVEAKERLPNMTYDSFVEALDALYALNAVDIEQPPFVTLSSVP